MRQLVRLPNTISKQSLSAKTVQADIKIRYGRPYHGGAWKVAYADFVTAMMAFFLLLWLLNVTTDEQKNAISNYFDPAQPKIATNVSGAGGVLGGTSVSEEGAMTQNTQPIQNLRTQNAFVDNTKKTEEELTDEELEEEIKKREERRFDQAEAELKQAIQETPGLQELQQHLKIDQTPEGLRIQIVDKEGEPMFPIGSARMFSKTEKLLELVSGVIRKLPNRISVKGHTDSIPYRNANGYSNWELSADRANASRRLLNEKGIHEGRFFTVVGKSATEPLLPEDPRNAQNRRISIILLRDSIVRQALQNSGVAPGKPTLEEEENSDSRLINTPSLSPGKERFP